MHTNGGCHNTGGEKISSISWGRGMEGKLLYTITSGGTERENYYLVALEGEREQKIAIYQHVRQKTSVGNGCLSSGKLGGVGANEKEGKLKLLNKMWKER